MYINGLGNGTKHLPDKIIDLWWQLNGKRLVRFPVNWYFDQDIDDLTIAVLKKVNELFKNSNRVAIIGSSAGGSLAINALFANDNQRLFAVVSRGRLIKGTFQPTDKRSLEYLSKKSRTLYNSVAAAERNIASLSLSQKKRILVLVPLFDGVVPVETMRLKGVTTHTSIAFGHFGGYLAHMIADLAIIDRFVRKD